MCEKVKSGKSKSIDSTPYKFWKYTNIFKIKVNIIFCAITETVQY